MAAIVLGVGELGASKTPGDVLRTFALGTCVALVLLDRRTHAVGMAHVALPDSAINAGRARAQPGYFADTGAGALLGRMMALTGAHSATRFIVKMAGGAQVPGFDATPNIGRRNELAIKKFLWERGMGVHAEDVGGTISRNVEVDVDTGTVLVTSAGGGSWTL